MRIAIFSATEFEIEPLRQFFIQNWEQPEADFFQKKNCLVQLCMSGVGPVSTALFLAKYLTVNELSLAVNVGVAGAFDRRLALGEVVHVVSERFGDVGIEEANGDFTDLFEMGLLDENEPPFSGGLLKNEAALSADFLKKVSGLTVSQVHGTDESIARILKKWPEIQVETMEGAAFFQACMLENVSFLEIRGISNYVEKRSRTGWQLGLAIENLNAVLIEMIENMADLTSSTDDHP